MKELLLMMIRGFIAAGLKTLLYLHKKKHGDEKNAILKGMMGKIIIDLKPLAKESNTHVDDEIIYILEEALKD